MAREPITVHGLVAGPHNEQGSPVVTWEGRAFPLPPQKVAPGDEVTVQILRPTKGLARLVTVDRPSPLRVSPPCPHFGSCGGCSYQHIPYPTQVEVKNRTVLAALGLVPGSDGVLEPPPHLTGVRVDPPLGAQRLWEYRNKMEYTASPRTWLPLPPPPGSPPPPPALGLFAPFSGNKVIDLQACHLQEAWAGEVRSWFKAAMAERGLAHHHSETHEGFFRTLLVKGSSLGQSLVMPVFHPTGAPEHPVPSPGDEEMARDILDAFVRAFPQVTSVWWCWNPKRNDSYADLEPRHHHGAPHIEEVWDDLRFRIGPLSFMQVNPWQTPLMYRRIMELAGLQPNDTVWDLYCGAGTISAYAARQVRRVVGIESVPQAVDHARAMAEENGLTNTRFHAGDMKDLLTPALLDAEGRPDVIITDPPRAGMHKDVIRQLNGLKARTMVYVSCKAESLAQDLALLAPAWRCVRIQTVDLMPHTLHMEALAVLVPQDPPEPTPHGGGTA